MNGSRGEHTRASVLATRPSRPRRHSSTTLPP
jgi:hypothetical protein